MYQIIRGVYHRRNETSKRLHLLAESLDRNCAAGNLRHAIEVCREGKRLSGDSQWDAAKTTIETVVAGECV